MINCHLCNRECKEVSDGYDCHDCESTVFINTSKNYIYLVFLDSPAITVKATHNHPNATYYYKPVHQEKWIPISTLQGKIDIIYLNQLRSKISKLKAYL